MELAADIGVPGQAEHPDVECAQSFLQLRLTRSLVPLSVGAVEMLHSILLCGALLAPFLMYKTSDPMRQQMSQRRG